MFLKANMIIFLLTFLSLKMAGGEQLYEVHLIEGISKGYEVYEGDYLSKTDSWSYFKPRPTYSTAVSTPAEVNTDATRITPAKVTELQTNSSSSAMHSTVAPTTPPKTTATVAETIHSTKAFLTAKFNPVTGFPHERTEGVTTANNLTPNPTEISTPLHSSNNTGTKVVVCKTFTCDGVRCFKYVDATEQPCKVNENFCELKQTYRQATWIEYRTSWRAGCTADCRQAAPCTSPYTYRCHQECCRAAATSCLKLDGFLHVPSNAASVTLSSLVLLLSLSVPSLTFGLLALASL